LKVAKRIVHYIKGSYQLGKKYCSIENQLVDYTNLDWDGDGDNIKSTLGYIFYLGSRPIVWSCKNHKVVSLSTIEEKYCGVFNANTEVIWIHNILGELGFLVEQLNVVYCDYDSKSVI